LPARARGTVVATVQWVTTQRPGFNVNARTAGAEASIAYLTRTRKVYIEAITINGTATDAS